METKQQAEQTLNHLVSILVFVSYIVCASCICWVKLGVEINILRVFKYENDEYFELWIKSSEFMILK